MFDRLEKLIGKEKLKKLNNSNVLIIGLGGVGGIACETLVRNGIGSITIIDNDKIEESNKNRQIIALDSTINMYKTNAF